MLTAAQSPPNRKPQAVALSRRERATGVVVSGLAIIVALVGGLGLWAGTTELAGAVIAQGTVVVDSNVKKVQHPTGGIVGDIRVRDGDHVTEGQIVMRLDETVTRSNLQVITKQLDEIWIRQARLKSERDSATTFEVPAILKARLGEPEIQEILAGERSLFASRQSGRASQKAQLRERIAQLSEEIGGQTGQQKAKISELMLAGKELDGLETLEGRQLVNASRMTTIRRDVARLDGERSQLTAAIAQSRGKIAEIELQIIQGEQEYRTEIVKELREIQSKEAELIEKRIAADDQLKRIDIRSPQAGVVHQMAVHTVGGVVSQTEPIMLIVPDGEALVIEAKIAPQDIDHVRPDQVAFVKFSAFNQRTTPEFNGIVQRVSADLTKEQQAQQPGQAFYVARIVLPEAELRRLGALKLLPGMPAEVHIKTADRSALSYFLKPLQDQIGRTFKEQ